MDIKLKNYSIKYCITISIIAYFIFVLSLNAQNRLHANNSSKDLNTAIEYLSSFTASEYFDSLGSVCDDLMLVDTLYKRALEYFDYDYSEALLVLSFAALPYNKIPTTIPLLNIKLDIPLPSVTDSIFVLKRKNLPKNLFYDSPNTELGDKDKLPHFFGTAFLSYEIDIFNISKFIGILIELFEETFKVEGKIDNRDLIVNELGSAFGKFLKSNKILMPSHVLILYNLFKITNIY